MFLFTEENIDKIKSVVYTNEPIPDEKRKHILYSKTKGLLKDFNYNRFKEIPFPTNNSMQTYSELLFLRDLPQDEEFVKVNDDIEVVFRKVCKEHNIEYPEKLVNELFFASLGIILDLKYYYNRPRPSQLAKELGKNQTIESFDALREQINPKFKKYEYIQKIIILRDEWTVENSCLTPTLKIRRMEIEQKFKDKIETWYTSKESIIFE
jgi:hypothetical protein